VRKSSTPVCTRGYRHGRVYQTESLSSAGARALKAGPLLAVPPFIKSAPPLPNHGSKGHQNKARKNVLYLSILGADGELFLAE
jgi:hypothetical protein